MPHLYHSNVIDAPIAVVWAIMRDFNGLPGWNPGIAKSEIERSLAPDQVGCVRKLTLPDGTIYRETLLSLSDKDRRFAYNILESPLTLTDYVAELTFTPIVARKTTFAEWTVSFDCDPVARLANTAIVREGIMEGGFRALQERVTKG